MIEWVDVRDALPPVDAPVLVFNGHVSIAERDTNNWWYLLANGEHVADTVLGDGALESITDVTHWARIRPPDDMAAKEQNGAQP